MGVGGKYLNATCSFLSVLLSNVFQNILVPQGKFHNERMKRGEMKDSLFLPKYKNSLAPPFVSYLEPALFKC